MPHDLNLISTVSIGLALAFVFGFIANRLRLPPLVGYLIAGVVVGPFTPGYVADSGLAGQLAELGVMLLMFGVGLHFSVADLFAVRRIAIPGAIGQILIATAIGTGMAMAWGWSLGAGLVIGLSMSVASTVVMLKALEERNAVATPNGRIAIGWLIVEDLAMVLALVLVPALATTLGGGLSGEEVDAGTDSLLWTVGMTLAKVGVFVGIALLLGPRIMPWVLRQVARTGSRELFTLAVLSMALGIAYASAELFGVSFALGAFFAGMVLHESELSQKAATNSLPLQDAFAVLFFVSVGMLFDPSIIIREPWMVAGVMLLILVGKTVAAMVIILLLGFPLSTALIVSASLAQIGEFSFILGGLGITYNLMDPEGLNLILAGALLSITLNPLVFAGVDRVCRWVQNQPSLRRRLEEMRQGRFNQLKTEMDEIRQKAEEAALAHRTFTPEELVERFPLFAELTPEQREVLLVHFEPQTADPGERIIRKGEKADMVYFISSGEVEVSIGKHRLRLEAGDYFGEMALLSGQVRSADVTAINYCKLVTLSRRDFREFLRRFPAIREKMAATTQKRDEMNRQIHEEMETEMELPSDS